MTGHNTLGSGFWEVIYRRALEIEMHLSDIHFRRELEMPVFYRAKQIGTRIEFKRDDFLTEAGKSTFAALALPLGFDFIKQ
jgi:GxxExxY protein